MTTSWSARPRSGRRTLLPRPCRPASARCRCCSATGIAPAGATCASRTTATTTVDRPGAAVAHDAGRGATPLHPRRGLADGAASGAWASRSHDIDGDGYPEVYLTSQAANRLQTLADGPAQPNYDDIAIERGATAHEPYTGDVELRSTAWHAEFSDVNNDGFMDLFVAKGNVEASRTTPCATRATCSSASRTGRSWRVAWTPASSASRAPAAQRWPTSTWTGCWTWWSSTGVRTWGCGATSAPARPMIRSRWATGWRSGCSRTAAQPRRDRRLGRGHAGDRVMRREVTVGGGHAGGQLGWIHFGLGDADRPRYGSPGRMASAVRPCEVEAEHVRRSSSAAPRDRSLGRRPGPRVTPPIEASPGGGHAPRLRHAGCHARAPGRDLRRAASARLRERADAAGFERVVIYADREHSANMAYLTGFDPRFEEALLVVGPDGDPAILVGNECWGMAGAAPLPMRRHRFQDFSLPSQPRDRSGPLADILARGRHRPGQPGRDRRLEDLRATREERRARLPRRRAAGARRERRIGRERDRPADRRRPTGCASSTRSSSSPPSSGPAARPRTACGAAPRPAARHDRARGGGAARAGTAGRCRAT